MPDAGPSAPSKVKGAGAKSAKGIETGTDGTKRFVVKKWNAVALWAWDIVVDNCAICRNHIMDLCEFHKSRLPAVMLTKRSRHRVSSESSVSYKRRVHSSLGHLQCMCSNEETTGLANIWLSSTHFISTASHAG